MPHGSGGGSGGGGKGGGIETLTPRTGLFTAFAALGAAGAAVWVFIKYPKIANRCIVTAAILTALFVTDGNVLEHPFVGLTALLVIGPMLAGEHEPDRASKRKKEGPK